ncbi:MAG: carboxypeptidase-like regulatory domain-containing protein, partial [Holophagales bacterium]|nr:carboxypeptidase-like regulatory domain-containing protein [Holophagales bacterium]
RVHDLEDRPLAGAVVTLLPGAALARDLPADGLAGPESSSKGGERAVRTVTDAAGRFTAAVPAGVYWLRAVAPGHHELGVPGLTVSRHGADEALPVDLGTVHLALDSPLRGVVFDRRGEPLADAAVHTSWADAEGRRHAPEERTEADGRFAVRGLPEEVSVELLVEADGHLPLRRRARVVLDESGNAMDLRLRLDSAGELEGRVVDPRGWPVAGAVVERAERAARGEGAPDLRAETDAEGIFRFEGLAPGPIELVARSDDGLSAPRTVTIDADPRSASESDADDLVLELRPAAGLEGRVLDSAGAGLAGARLRLEPERPGRVAQASDTWNERVPGDDGTRHRGTAHESTSDDDGGFRISPARAGRYRLTAAHGAYHAVARLIDLDDGDATWIELRLTRRRDLDGLRLRGQVVDGSADPVPGAALRLLPFGGGSVVTARSEADGGFELTATQAGPHILETSHPRHAGHRSDPIRLGSGPQEPLLVELTAGGAVEGRVYGVGDSERSRLRLRADAVHAPTVHGTVRPGGSYRLEPLAAGTWTVQAWIDARRVLDSVVVTAGAEAAPLDLRFEDGHRVRGTVLHGGEPAAGARLVLTCRDSPFSGRARSDLDGAFRFHGVPAATCDLSATGADGRLQAHRAVQVDPGLDREGGGAEVQIELGGYWLRGRVVRAYDHHPLPGVRLEIDAGNAPSAAPLRTRTDSEGAFSAELSHDRPVRLRAVEPGYGALEHRATAAPFGAPDAPVELILWPAEPLELQVVGPWGEVPAQVTVVADNGLAGGLQLVEIHRPSIDGRIVLDGLAPGLWRLTVQADGRFGRTTVRMPSAPLEIVLGGSR